MRFFGVFILCISLFFSATSYAASEVDCKNFILRLSPSVEARIDALAAKYEGKVRISFDMELFTEVFAKILHRHFDFEKFWKDLPPVDRLHAWAKLMEAREDYKEMFLMPEMYELWEEKLDLPMSRAEWEKLITPESKAERGKVEWISDLTRADLYIFGKTNAEQAKIKMQMKNDSPVFLKFLDHGPDQKTMEFRIRDDPGLRGFRLPIHLLAALAQLAESDLFHRWTPYDKVVSGVTEHLHFGFHEFTELSTDEFKARLTELNLLWLVKLVQAHPELSVDELRMRFFLDTFPADSGYSARKNPMSFKSHISEKGIIRYYVPDEDLPYIVKKTNYELRNHFELRSHFADPVTEIEEVIRWMEMSDEEFRLQVIRTAREMFSIDQSLEKKIQQCDPGVITTLLTRGWLTEPTPCKK